MKLVGRNMKQTNIDIMRSKEELFPQSCLISQDKLIPPPLAHSHVLLQKLRLSSQLQLDQLGEEDQFPHVILLHHE